MNLRKTTKLNKAYLFLIVFFFQALISCNNRESTPLQVEISEPTFLWSDSTALYLPLTEEWTNRVEVSDINNDGLLDLLFANGGNYSQPGEAEPARVFLNQGRGKKMKEVTEEIFMDEKFYSRVIKVHDISNDGFPDIIVGTTFQSQTQLYLGSKEGEFKKVTKSHLPQTLASVGDIELGDVDADGDLDMVLADWGKGSNMSNNGGQTMLWINDGKGKFTNKTTEQMPQTLVGFSWDIEFVDVDNDYDLDIAISCKRCPGSKIYFNDGRGYFQEKRSLPAYTNNYELEPMDVNGDGFIDFTTVNDGEIVNEISWSRREHLFINDSTGRFIDATLRLWPDSSNIGEDDNNIVFLDYDSDGDPDFLLSSLTGEDRLLVNDGKGKFSLKQPVLENNNTPHTLSMVTADINGDCKLDIIMGQGEGTEDLEERIFIGTNIPDDTMEPLISNVAFHEDSLSNNWRVNARIHDYKSPLKRHDFESIEILTKDGRKLGNMRWYGEYLWSFSSSESTFKNGLVIQAVDKCGNIAKYEIE